MSYLYVALGGALGAVSRYAVSSLGCLSSAPYVKTLAVNVAGCLLIGVAWGVISALSLQRVWYNILIAGFLGGFTTYSTFSLETVRLAASGHIATSLLYVGTTVAGCIGACAVGLYCTSRILNTQLADII